jgi:hypothetical protein
MTMERRKKERRRMQKRKPDESQVRRGKEECEISYRAAKQKLLEVKNEEIKN